MRIGLMAGQRVVCVCARLCTAHQPPDSFDRTELDVLAMKRLEKCRTFPGRTTEWLVGVSGLNV